MTKTKRTLRAILALVMAIVMVGSVIPTMAYAADVADNLENQLDQSATFLEKVTTAFYNFFQRIVNFFRNLFGKGDEEPEPAPDVPDDGKNEVGDEEALKEVLKDGGKVYLAQDFVCKGGESIVIPGNVKVTIYLQGNTIKNPVSGGAAIINKGELVIYGDGSIINGANDKNGSHTISNEGTLVINGGNIGTDYTAGAAVYNDGGFATINGGIYASKQESERGAGRCAYAFVNNEGTMVVNNANLEGKTHGLFAAYNGKLIVNGGMYKMDGNGGLGCYVAYATNTAEVLLIGGIVHTNNPRNGNVFFVSGDGNKFNADAVATDNITYVGTEIYKDGVKQNFQEAEPWTVNGGTIYLKDVTITAKEGNALTVKNDTKLIIDGDVKLIGAKSGAGIYVAEGTRLEITGSGSLTAIGNEGKEYDEKQYYSVGNYTDYAKTGGSGIGVASNAMLVVDGLNELTAEGYGAHAFGIGGNGALVKIEDTTIKYVRGGFVNVTGQYYDTSYNKSEPEGGAAIGGADIAIIKSHIIKAEGGSKSAGIGAQYHQPANITIRFSEIDKVVGGSSSAGIGGSRIDKNYPGQDVNIIIEDSKISAYGGYFGAGIGSGYDTNCSATEKAPMHTIYIKGDSEINATGGKYAAGIGTGYHVANLDGEIETTVKVTAQSGEKLKQPSYTRAQDVGFGVVDPNREAANNYCTFKYRGIEFGIPQPINPATSVIVTEKLDFMIGDAAKEIEVTIAPENATIIGKSFISSDESVATVDAKGVVTPVALGKATITVTVASNDGSIKTAETAVTVNPIPVDSVTIEPEKVTFVLDETATQTETLSAVVEPANATFKDVEWKSSNEDVATVDANGVVTVKDRGRTTITAISTFDNTKYDEVAVEVQKIEGEIFAADDTELKDAMLACGRGESVYVALDSDLIVSADTPAQYNIYMFIANGRDVTIDLNGNDIILDETVSKNIYALFTTANGGTLNIVGDGTVEVNNGNSGIFWAMNKNDQINIYGGTYISNSKNAEGLAIIYTNSGNVDVYGGKFVPLDGVVCANAEDIQGNRLSTVFHEGTLLKHTLYQKGDSTRIQLEENCELIEVEIDGETWYRVTKFIPVEEIVLESNEITIEYNEAEKTFGTGKIVATVYPENATYKELTYSSSDESIATVDAEGNITGITGGKAIITVTAAHDNKEITAEVTVKTYGDSIYDSTKVSGEVTLQQNLNTKDSVQHYNGNREFAIRDDVNYVLNLNGQTINHYNTYQDGKNTGYTYLYTTAYGGKLTVNGEGTVNSANSEGSACIFYAQRTSEIEINGGTYNVDRGVAVWAGNGSKIVINGGSFISTGSDNEELIYSSGGIIDIYGGFFHNTGWESRPVNVADANRGTGFINIYGGTFVNFDPRTGGDDPNNIKVVEGYTVISEEQENGDIWYSVVEHIPLEEITVDKTNIGLLVGETDKITAGIIPADATHNKLTYTSSDESIATVDAQGNITAISRGKATITVAEKNDKKQTVVTVKVEDPDPVGSYPVYTVEELVAAIEAGETFIALKEDFEITTPIEIPANANVTINGKGNTIARVAGGEAVSMINLAEGATITLVDVIVDGGAEWSGEIDATLGRGTENTGVATTGAIIVAAKNSAIVLGEGAALQNNDGAYAVHLGTRIGATLTLDGGEIINNNSEAGAVWGGGTITINSGKINSNSSTGLAGAIRMVGNCNLIMNGGEINNNKATTNGGAIWGYGASTYNFNGGEMAYNSGAVGGAIHTGEGSVINISGDFELHNNTGTEGGAVRFTNRTTLNMTGGKIYDNTSTNNSNWDAFYGWNIAANIKGGEIADDFTLDSGLYCTLGAADITGVVHFALNTGHNTALLTSDFKGFMFTVANGDNFAAFNLKPADGYVYTEGDEDKLVCLNEGYKTYWDADKGVFKIKEYPSVSTSSWDDLISARDEYIDCKVVLENDFAANDMVYFMADVTLDLNEKTMVADNKGQYVFGIPGGSTLRITGDGVVDAGKGFLGSGADGKAIIDGGTYNFTNTGTLNSIKHCSLVQNGSKIVVNDGKFTTDVEDAALFFATSNATIEINGGFFENTADKTPDLLSMGTNKNNTNRIILKGGTFVNYNPLEDRMCYKGSWEGISYEQFSGPWMLVWKGYTVVAEEQENGDIWYSVVPETEANV